MSRTFLATVACAIVTALTLPAFAADAPGDVDLKSKEGVTQLFETLRDNGGGD